MMQQVNLYQPELRPRRVVLPARQVVLIVGLFALALTVVHAWTYSRLLPLRERAAAVEQQLIAAEARVDQLRESYPPRVADAALRKRLERRRATLAHTREIAVGLRNGAYGAIDGLSGYLAGLARQHVDGTWLTRVRVVRGGRSLGLEGKALAAELVPAYVDRLSNESLFRGKAFEALELEAVSGGLQEIGFTMRTAGLAEESER